MSELSLMQTIKTRWGIEIANAAGDSASPAFLAALVADESGGNPNATRFEPRVYKRLQSEYPTWEDSRLRANATSWGLTQIMGINYSGTPSALANPSICLNFTIKMLEDFAEHWKLDLLKDYEKLFHCWNTGNPEHPTFDPNYVERGLSRMKLWATL